MGRFSTTVAVVGAGPAGSSLACLAAGQGLPVILFHSSRDKHCGGGVPPRAFDEIPWLKELTSARKDIHRIRLFSPSGKSCDVQLNRPVWIFDRAELDRELRDRAVSAGAKLVPERAISIAREGREWIIGTNAKEYRAGFIAGADGVSGIVRRAVATNFDVRSLSLCAGYYLAPPEPDGIIIGYMKRKAAYAWIFPGPGRASAGIGTPIKGNNRETLLADLRSWLERSFPGATFDYSRPYSALVSTYTAGENRVCGDGWALVGDAAGVAEPVTREGIFFSIKSAELCASALLEGRAAGYGKALSGFLSRQYRGASLARKYLLNSFWSELAIRHCARSPGAQKRLQKFFSGTLRYRELLF